MENKKVLSCNSRQDFREWLSKNHGIESECWLVLKRGRPLDDNKFYYLDAVEEALCFGWIDSSLKVIDGVRMQRFSPRRKNSFWTELNKERVRRLEKLGLMTDAGRRVLPEMDVKKFKVDTEVEKALKGKRIWSKFKKLPPLYQRVRASNLAFYKKRDPMVYQKMLNHLIERTKKNQTFGEWNDYGRLLDY